MTLVEQLAQEISIISGLPTVLVMDKAQIIIQELRLVQLAEDQTPPRTELDNSHDWATGCPYCGEEVGTSSEIEIGMVIMKDKMLSQKWRKVILEEH